MALTQVTTDGVKDDAVTLAKQAAGTDGQVITYDAAGNPKAIGPGTDGQVLTSAGAGAEPAFENAVSEGTQVKSTGESGGTKFLREDGDGTSSWQTVNTTPEGTAILSTGESGGTKFLREDGDGTSSWQAVPAGGVDGISSSADANAITIDSSEHVIVGGTTVSNVHTNNQDFVVGNSSNSNTGMALNCASGGYCSIVMSDSAGDKNKGLLAYNHADDTFKICNDPATGSDGLVLLSNNDVKIATGNLVIGTHGKGIDFSASNDTGVPNTSQTSELLHEYEEGTFTPTINSGYTVSYDGQVGYYTKIGNVVTITGYIKVTSVGSSSNEAYAYIKSLPFASSTGGWICNGVTFGWQMSMADDVAFGYIGGTDSWITMMDYHSGGNRDHHGPNDVWQANARTAFSATYITSS